MPLNLPTILTLARIAAVPVVLASMAFVPGPLGHWLAFGVFTVAALTDVADGALARHRNQSTALGRMLDPIADKLLVATVLMMLVAQQTIAGINVLPAMVILAREILVSGLRELLAELNASDAVSVTQLAKWKTVLQMVAIGLVILNGVADPIGVPISTIGIVLLWVAAVLTLYTGYRYFRAGLSHILARGN